MNLISVRRELRHPFDSNGEMEMDAKNETAPGRQVDAALNKKLRLISNLDLVPPTTEDAHTIIWAMNSRASSILNLTGGFGTSRECVV